jgi:phosphoribosyl isomerase A
LLDAVRWPEFAAAAALIVTDIGRDGTLAGPDVDGLASVLDATTVDVIASGGVSSLDDIETLTSLEADGRRLAGVIVGKALYEGAFTVEEAMAACAACA